MYFKRGKILIVSTKKQASETVLKLASGDRTILRQL